MPSGQSKGPRYAIGGGLLLIAASIVLYFAMCQPKQKASVPMAEPKPSTQAARSNALAEEEELEVPEEEKLAEATSESKTRRVAADQSWACAGDIDRAAAVQIMQENRSVVRACYERRLKMDNTLQGTSQLTLRVGSDGRVTAVKVEGTPKDAIFRECVKKAAQGWKFPRPQNGACAVIGQPVTLTPLPE